LSDRQSAHVPAVNPALPQFTRHLRCEGYLTLCEAYGLSLNTTPLADFPPNSVVP